MEEWEIDQKDGVTSIWHGSHIHMYFYKNSDHCFEFSAPACYEKVPEHILFQAKLLI